MASGRFPGLGSERLRPQHPSSAFPPALAGSGVIETGSPITVAGPRRLRTDFPFHPVWAPQARFRTVGIGGVHECQALQTVQAEQTEIQLPRVSSHSRYDKASH